MMRRAKQTGEINVYMTKMAQNIIIIIIQKKTKSTKLGKLSHVDIKLSQIKLNRKLKRKSQK